MGLYAEAERDESRLYAYRVVHFLHGRRNVMKSHAYGSCHFLVGTKKVFRQKYPEPASL